MREIEFRGKRKNDGKWLYGDLSYGGPENNHKKFANINIWEDRLKVGYVVKQETLGQYTGLKDKNGKKIYEGDIVKCSFYPDYNFEIKFAEFSWYGRKILTSEYIELSVISNCDIEVIGNIYDNPKLLEVRDEYEM